MMRGVRLALFATCLTETMYPEAAIATVRVLERLGHRVEFREQQTCCGQLHFNTGYHGEALSLARRFTKVFGDAETIVAPSASCVAMVREFYPYLAEQAGDRRLADAVSTLAPRVLELTELLTRLGVDDVGAAFPHRVAYHPTCHSLRLLRLGDAPLALLRSVRGLELAALPQADECCGFGGTFAIKNAAVSTAMLADKVAAVHEAGAEVVAAVDASCLAHIGGALSRSRSGVRTVHVAEILAAGRA
jgi:L-lactate dehydrogenase complex protein LldE